MVEVQLLNDVVEKLKGMAMRYYWLREHATGYHLDNLADLDEDEWDNYIDKAINRQ